MKHTDSACITATSLYITCIVLATLLYQQKTGMWPSYMYSYLSCHCEQCWHPDST